MTTVAVGLFLLACTGPDSGDDHDPTPTPTATATATATASPTATATATLEPTATRTPSATATRTASPTPAASPTSKPTATVSANTLPSMLPTTAELPNGSWSMTEEGFRTAQELADAYQDSAAHLARLESWGFQTHVYRAFSNDGGDDAAPDSMLTTINLYGSPEQAGEALTWLKGLATSQGAQEGQAPELGDAAVAMTIPTAAGVPTASIYIRSGSSIFIYFAEGGDPLPAITDVAETVFARIEQ